MKRYLVIRRKRDWTLEANRFDTEEEVLALLETVGTNNVEIWDAERGRVQTLPRHSLQFSED